MALTRDLFSLLYIVTKRWKGGCDKWQTRDSEHYPLTNRSDTVHTPQIVQKQLSGKTEFQMLCLYLDSNFLAAKIDSPKLQSMQFYFLFAKEVSGYEKEVPAGRQLRKSSARVTSKALSSILSL